MSEPKTTDPHHIIALTLARERTTPRECATVEVGDRRLAKRIIAALEAAGVRLTPSTAPSSPPAA